MEILGQDKFILDATAGYRMMWFDKHHPNALYVDSRPECEPDQVANYTKLPYPDESFKLIVFDPPHIVKSGNNNSNMQRCFGRLEAETWESDLRKAFAELWRLLKPEGVLIFKWNNRYIQSDRVLALAPVAPLFYQVSSSKDAKSDKGNRVRLVSTLWFCFMKIPNGHELHVKNSGEP